MIHKHKYTVPTSYSVRAAFTPTDILHMAFGVHIKHIVSIKPSEDNK